MVIVSKSEVRKIKSIERIIKQQFDKKDIPDGAEICEVQLMSLANKIHNTEINHEIDKHLSSINELFADTDKDELIKKFFSVEFTRFYNYYQKSKNLNVSEGSRDRDGGREGGRDFGGKNDSTRYFINVGSKDGFDWMQLKDFLKEQLSLGRDDVFKVEVKDSFSFFNTENEVKEKVLAYFTDFKHEGRFVNVEVSENRGGGGRRNDRRGGGRRDDKRGGGKRDERRSGGGSGNRSERRGGGDSYAKPRRSGSDSKSSSDRSRRSDSGSGPSRPRRSRR
jgi:ATP-dependent RNA helicase DeaD